MPMRAITDGGSSEAESVVERRSAREVVVEPTGAGTLDEVGEGIDGAAVGSVGLVERNGVAVGSGRDGLG